MAVDVLGDFQGWNGLFFTFYEDFGKGGDGAHLPIREEMGFARIVAFIVAFQDEVAHLEVAKGKLQVALGQDQVPVFRVRVNQVVDRVARRIEDEILLPVTIVEDHAVWIQGLLGHGR